MLAIDQLVKVKEPAPQPQPDDGMMRLYAEKICQGPSLFADYLRKTLLKETEKYCFIFLFIRRVDLLNVSTFSSQSFRPVGRMLSFFGQFIFIPEVFRVVHSKVCPKIFREAFFFLFLL